MNFSQKICRNKSKLFVFVLCLTICFLLIDQNILNSDSRDYLNRPSKSQLINEHKLSDRYISFLYANQSRLQTKICRLPRFELEGHESVEKYTPCKQRAEWGYLKSNHWNLNMTVVKPLKGLKCQYRAVYRENDFKLNHSPLTNLVDKQLVEDDVIEVVCRGSLYGRKMIFNHVYVQIVPKMNPDLDINQLNRLKTSQCKPLNILLLSYDSISRVSWFKRLPKTADYILNEMKFNLLYGQSILGDGTPACMIPLLTGKTEEELPSALKSDPNGKFVDQVYPFIWNELHPRGYMSYQMEDWPQVTTFTYRMRGMSNKTVHHYMRPYQMSVWSRVCNNYWKHQDDLCYGSTKRHKKALDVMTEFIETYKDYSKNHLAIMHFIENSHDGNSRSNQIDGDLFDFLQSNFKKDNFKNTAIFLFSDHGSRFGADRTARQGFLEERQPFFSLYLPPEYARDNPQKVANLKRNAQQITTAFDIHETVRDLTCLDSKKSKRAISILNEIPVTRTCSDCEISLHYCVCGQDWIDLKTTDIMGNKAATFSINYINKLLKVRENYCHRLKLKFIDTIRQATIEKKLYFKVNFVTLPNHGAYEVLVKVLNSDVEWPEFEIMSPQYISRNNAYGNQPKCLEKATKIENPIDLRKFCYCK